MKIINLLQWFKVSIQGDLKHYYAQFKSNMLKVPLTLAQGSDSGVL